MNNDNNEYNNIRMETCYLQNYQIWMRHFEIFNVCRSTWTHTFSPSYNHATEDTVHIFWGNFLSMCVKGLNLISLLKPSNIYFMSQSIEQMTYKEKCYLIGVKMAQLAFNKSCFLNILFSHFCLKDHTFYFLFFCSTAV